MPLPRTALRSAQTGCPLGPAPVASVPAAAAAAAAGKAAAGTASCCLPRRWACLGYASGHPPCMHHRKPRAMPGSCEHTINTLHDVLNAL